NKRGITPDKVTYDAKEMLSVEPTKPEQVVSQIGPSTHVARDRWTVDDSLGYFPYAYAIYRFLTDKETQPPLAISIQAPWGGGKTSMMRMIQAQLDPLATKKLESFDVATRETATVADIISQLKQELPPKTKDGGDSSARAPLQAPAIPQRGETRATV